MKETRRGFSLLELMIVVILIGIIVSLAVPSFRSIGSAQLRTEATRLIGLVRETFTRSALSGTSYRIVIDLEESAYWLESSTDAVSLSEDMEKEKDEKGLFNFFKEEEKKNDFLKDPNFKAVEDELGQKQKLAPGIRFYGLWVEHLSERLREGHAAIYFFPDGYVEEAQITLTDDPENENLIVLVVDPLTGEARTEQEELAIGKE